MLLSSLTRHSSARNLLRSTYTFHFIRNQSLASHHTPIPYYPKQKSYKERDEQINPINPEEYSQAEPNPDDQIIIAMSSGVDSSVCAALYAKKYKNVKGIYMANWSQTASCTERDWKDVQKLCEQLNIPCERVNFEKEYWLEVFEPMIQKYSEGLTPNPDTSCNKYVKFGKLFQYLNDIYKTQKWWLVTGHYARIMKHTPTGEYHLLRGLSRNKDQSYYLSTIPPSTMSQVLLPIGHHIKPEVRELAKTFNLHVAQKPDSQGLCFVSPDQNNFTDFLRDYIPANPGNIVTEDGKIWGKHDGLWTATIGQRARISMPQADPKYSGTWFVSDKDPIKNELVIVRGSNNPKLFKSGVVLNSLDWVYPVEKVLDIPNNEIQFQMSSLSNPFDIETFSVSTETNQVSIRLKKPGRALAPGQVGCLYRGNQVLGSGTISSVE